MKKRKKGWTKLKKIDKAILRSLLDQIRDRFIVIGGEYNLEKKYCDEGQEDSAFRSFSVEFRDKDSEDWSYFEMEVELDCKTKNIDVFLNEFEKGRVLRASIEFIEPVSIENSNEILYMATRVFQLMEEKAYSMDERVRKADYN